VHGRQHLSPLLKMNHVTVMPHAAGITQESQLKAARIACKLLTNLVQW
jgi:phosphoglycerate dehydrogenase-like enzyme